MNVIDIVKAKLPDSRPSDDVLNIHIEEVGQSIKTYCNRSDIPSELRFVHANMVIDLINGNARKDDPDASVSVASIKEGDVQVSFGSVRTSTSERSMEALLFNYKAQLNSFRKLKW